MKRVQTLLLLSALVFTYGCGESKQKTQKNKNVRSIVFMSSFWGIPDMNPPNGAVLVTDKDSIAFIENLFKDNALSAECACGFDYQILFLDENNEQELIELFYNDNQYERHNEEIKKTINDLEEQLYKSPTHYVYDVKVEIKPDLAMKEFRRQNYFVFTAGEHVGMSEDAKYNTIQLLYNGNLDELTKELQKFPFITRIREAKDRIPDELKEEAP